MRRRSGSSARSSRTSRWTSWPERGWALALRHKPAGGPHRRDRDCDRPGVATAGEGVFRSEDGGKRWTAANSGLDGRDIRGLAVAPNDGRLHAQIRGKGLYRSFDRALSWERVDDGPTGALRALVSVNLPTGMGGIFLYAATDQGLVRGPD